MDRSNKLVRIDHLHDLTVLEEDIKMSNGSVVHVQDNRIKHKDRENLETVEQCEIILNKFIEHHQLFEFIEVFQHYHKSTGVKILPLNKISGKNFLHLAVEYNSV